MPENELLQVAELEQTKISGKACLHSFSSNNADSDVCFLDHRNIVTAISDTGNQFLCVDFD